MPERLDRLLAMPRDEALAEIRKVLDTYTVDDIPEEYRARGGLHLVPTPPAAAEDVPPAGNHAGDAPTTGVEPYVRFPKRLYDGLLLASLTGAEIRIVLAVVRLTLGHHHRPAARISYATLAERARLNKRTARKIVAALLEKRVLIVSAPASGQRAAKLAINQEPASWRVECACGRTLEANRAESSTGSSAREPVECAQRATLSAPVGALFEDLEELPPLSSSKTPPPRERAASPAAPPAENLAGSHDPKRATHDAPAEPKRLDPRALLAARGAEKKPHREESDAPAEPKRLDPGSVPEDDRAGLEAKIAEWSEVLAQTTDLAARRRIEVVLAGYRKDLAELGEAVPR